MSEVLGSIVGALAVVGIPVAAWLSRRATREGRLILRVETLGRAFALMPDSAEKETFKGHLTSAVENLNTWLDADNTKQRNIIRTVSVVIYVVGIFLVFVAVPTIGSETHPFSAILLGTAAGVVIAGLRFIATYCLERRFQKHARDRRAETERLAAEARAQARRRGEHVPLT